MDTGSRGRPGKKRKREDERNHDVDGEGGNKGENMVGAPKAPVAASTGFIHLLPPTPEIWTASLPHRTQVVYTPDYSYILHRLKAQPGKVMIEAGAGSGSFTHAAARAIFNGFADHDALSDIRARNRQRRGRVWSYEFHEQRVEKLREEITAHGLDGIVEIMHKDVCQDGFGIEGSDSAAVSANAIFLDLPAPWLALKHLTRAVTARSVPDLPIVPDNLDIKVKGETGSQTDINSIPHTAQPQLLLDPTSAIHLCTFSPCIEQVQRTITTLRQMGWLEIEMVEVAAKRIEVRRERVGLQEEGLRGVNASPASVEEAVTRLREIEGRSKTFHNERCQDHMEPEEAGFTAAHISKQQRLENIRGALESRKLYKEGRLVHKAEPDLKTHTSYLVFAILPREWTSADEQLCHEKWPSQVQTEDRRTLANKKKMKKSAKVKGRVSQKVIEKQKEEGIKHQPPSDV